MEKIKIALRSRTVYQSAITSVSTVINGLLGVAFYILAARALGPSDFGILIIALTTLTLVADIATVGADTGIVRFVGRYYESDKNKALQFLKLGLEVKLFVGIVILFLGFLLVPAAAINIFAKPELIIPLRIAIVGAFGMLLFTFATSALQAVQKFWTWGFLNISANSLRLIAILFLLYSGSLNISLTLTSYVACIFLGFFVALLFLPNFFKARGEVSQAREFFHYNKWIALFVLIAAISGRLDTYITAKFLSLTDVGIYGVAVSLSAIGAQIVAGITTVVAPKLASFDTDKKAIEYLKKLQLFVILLGIAGVVVGIPASGIAIPFFYGKEYIASVAPLAVLIVAQAVFLFSVPAHASVVYYFSYPKLFVYISIANFLIIAGFGWFLISNFGYMGAAYTVLLGNLSNLLIPAIWTLNKFKRA